ncbi:hypothetical protein [Streptomyces sp. NPDC004721]
MTAGLQLAYEGCPGAGLEGQSEAIALLVGHSSQATTEAVYRKQLRLVITKGADLDANYGRDGR